MARWSFTAKCVMEAILIADEIMQTLHYLGMLYIKWIYWQTPRYAFK